MTTLNVTLSPEVSEHLQRLVRTIKTENGRVLSYSQAIGIGLSIYSLYIGDYP